MLSVSNVSGALAAVETTETTGPVTFGLKSRPSAVAPHPQGCLVLALQVGSPSPHFARAHGVRGGGDLRLRRPRGPHGSVASPRRRGRFRHRGASSPPWTRSSPRAARRAEHRALSCGALSSCRTSARAEALQCSARDQQTYRAPRLRRVGGHRKCRASAASQAPPHRALCASSDASEAPSPDGECETRSSPLPGGVWCIHGPGVCWSWPVGPRPRPALTRKRKRAA